MTNFLPLVHTHHRVHLAGGKEVLYSVVLVQAQVSADLNSLTAQVLRSLYGDCIHETNDFSDY